MRTPVIEPGVGSAPRFWVFDEPIGVWGTNAEPLNRGTFPKNLAAFVVGRSVTGLS